MKKVLVTGVKGQLGYDVVKKLQLDGCEVLGVDIDDFDITNCNQTESFILNCKPNTVVHCAAYTAVDKAESEQDLCYKINVEGSENIAKACAKINAQMVYVSTDYVYGGIGESVYETTEPTAPLSVYGKTKLQGENACKSVLNELYIIRTSWVFGKNGNNFVKTMLRLASERPALSVVNDQVGSPTYTVDLANFICHLINTKKYGVYHFSNENFCSWYDFAKEVFSQKGIRIELNGIPTSQYKTAAVRPLNSRLSKKSVYSTGYTSIPTWQDALKRYLEEIKL
jgi:dTDP-4-dehydrorhamnose reductase